MVEKNCLTSFGPIPVGLLFYLNKLEHAYETHGASLMSRADFWALAGITAVEYATSLDRRYRDNVNLV